MASRTLAHCALQGGAQVAADLLDQLDVRLGERTSTALAFEVEYPPHSEWKAEHRFDALLTHASLGREALVKRCVRRVNQLPRRERGGDDTARSRRANRVLFLRGAADRQRPAWLAFLAVRVELEVGAPRAGELDEPVENGAERDSRIGLLHQIEQLPTQPRFLRAPIGAHRDPL